MGKNVVVIGTQWGDEGKGKVVDWLTEHAQGVVRFQGGHNAGHTLVIAASGPCCGSFPPGSCAPACPSTSQRRRRVARGPAAGDRRARGAGRQRAPAAQDLAGVSAGPALPRRARQAREGAMGDAKIGTTGRGIGPAYEDKIARRAIRLQDLFYPDRFAAKLKPLLELHNFVLTQYFKRDAVPYAKTLDDTLALGAGDAAAGRRRRGAVAGGPRRRTVAAVRGRAGRAARHRSRHVSVRDVVELPRRNGRVGAGVGPKFLDYVLGIVKAYTTRVGTGPFPTELATTSAQDSRSAATSSARSPAARAAAGGSTSPHCCARSS